MHKENNIPKTINYCWFGGKPLPEEVKKCIESWKKYCPDYEIVEWNEKNYDIYKNFYTETAYKNKQWAFLTDYVRLDVIYSKGGVYLDTDVELLKPLDPLLNNTCYVGMEQPGLVNTGLGFGAIQNHPFVLANKKYYENKQNFLDKNGKFKKIICVKITTGLLKERGLEGKNQIQKVEDVVVYPVDYFCPKKMGTNKVTITENTVSIHHYDASWKSNSRVVRKIGYYMIPVKQFIKRIVKK